MTGYKCLGIIFLKRREFGAFLNMDIYSKKLNSFSANIVNNDINSINGTNGSNGAYKSQYSIRGDFKLLTEESDLALELARFYKDEANYACFLHIVNTLGAMRTRELHAQVKDDIEQKKQTKFPVRSPVKYFVYKFKQWSGTIKR